MSARLYFLQRLSAFILAPLVIVHLSLIVLAVRGGLSGAEILARTQGHLGWGLFYSLFVVCAALHGGIGLRTILIEWVNLTDKTATIIAHTLMLIMLILGLRAVYAVVIA